MLDTRVLIAGLLVVTVVCLIRAELRGNRRQTCLFKPAATILVILVVAAAMLSGRQMSAAYSIFIMAGLLFSLGGDIALIFQEDSRAFRLGLVLFLAAHIMYIYSFINFSGATKVPVGSTLILALLGAIVYAVLYPHLERLKVPVFIYVLVISYMVNRAIATHFSPVFSAQQAWQISIGAVLFYFSDLMLALNRFGHPFRYHRISLVFYYGGQLGIALSTFGPT